MDFSVIVPVYNCRETLSACVQSILLAKIPSSEILLIDDGSTDGSGQLCDALASRYPLIRVIHQPNQGAAAARNAGLSACTGSQILFADADDTLDSAALGMLLSSERCRNADLTIFGMEFRYFHHGRHTKSEFYCYGSGSILPADTWGGNLTELFRANALSSLCSKVFQRDIIENYHLRLNPELFLYEDLDFCLRYLSFCNKIRTNSEPVYRYHLPADSRKILRRLSWLDSIPVCLEPIEASLHQLMEHNRNVLSHDCRKILESLHLTLARQKIAVTDIAGIRKVCLDYIDWEAHALPSPTPSEFRSRICSLNIYSLWIQQKNDALRHRFGIWYRWFLSFLKGGTNGH